MNFWRSSIYPVSAAQRRHLMCPLFLLFMLLVHAPMQAPTQTAIPQSNKSSAANSIADKALPISEYSARYKDKTKIADEKFQYNSRGALRMLTRVYTDGSVSRLLYFFTGSGLQEEFHQNPDGSSYFKKYTPAGSLHKKASLDKNGAVVSQITHTFNNDGTIASKEEIQSKDVPAFRKVTLYAPDGRAAAETTYADADASLGKSGRIISSVSYKYDKAGKLISSIETGRLHEKNTESVFDKNGNLKKQRMFADRVLKKEIEYTENSRRAETYFFNGVPVLCVYYRGAQKEKEEVLR